MMTQSLRRIFAREIRSVQQELLAFPDETQMWELPPGFRNSSGTLALHLAGNLQALIGAQLGSTGYVRDRDAEFASRNVPRTEILALLDTAAAAVEATLSHLTEEDLAKDYPLAFGGATLSVEQFLIHLEAHLAYHLGQMDYHRRMVTGETGTVNALSIPALMP